MTHTIGSYEFDTFQKTEKTREILRLNRQITTTLDLDKRIWQQAGLTAGMRVLDLGCGSGTIGCEMAKIVYPGDVIGIDRSDAMVQQAERLRQHEQLHHVSFRTGDAYDLPFPDNQFDFVYARLLFQHLAEPLSVLTEIHRILKPGGSFCVLDVDEGWFTLYPEPPSFSLLCQRLVIAQQSQGGDPYIGRKLGRYFHIAGFEDVQTLVHPISSDEFGLKNLFDLLSFGTPYQRSQADLTDIATQARTDVYALLEQPYAWAGIGFFASMGRKL